MSALRSAFFILYLESCISRLNVIPCHDLTLSVGEPDNAAAKLRSEQTVTPLHEQSPATYFLRLNNLETFVELVGARPLHLLSQTVLPLKSPTGAFIASQTRSMCFERSGRGQEPSRGHKFSILENVVLHRDFTSSMHLHFRSDLVGACLPQTLLIFAPCGAKERRVVLT